MEGERRQVTILFCDIVGSTALASKLDPEEMMEVITGAHQLVGEAIYRYEGTIAQLLGDGLLAFFGAPLSHEDDPERAIRAALEIQESLERYRQEIVKTVGDFQMRIGINTGMVVVGEVGAGAHMEYLALGDAVNLAARMEQNAPPGGVLISHETYKFVRGVFDVEPQDPLQVKGVANRLQTYLVLAAKARAFHKPTRGVEGVETRTIGRDNELERLKGAFMAVLERGERQFVTVLGEPGVGKSRLLYEFDNWTELRPESFYYFKGRASQQMRQVPYSLLRDLLAFRFQITDGDSAETARSKLVEGIASALDASDGGCAPEDFADEAVLYDNETPCEMQAHILGQMLGLDFSDSQYVKEIHDQEELHNRALVYLENYFRALARQDPVLILLEDIHWADDSSLDTFNRLALALADEPIFVVNAARPYLYQRRPQWGEGQLFHHNLELEPLTRADCIQLVEEILRRVENLPGELRELVADGADGNPLYVEELIKTLIEDKVIMVDDRPGRPWRVDTSRLEQVRVPPSLTAVLQARLDRLPVEERAVLGWASVVGRIFWDLAVAELGSVQGNGAWQGDIGPPLAALRKRELVFQRETSAFEDAQEYIFKHAVIRDVAYDGILKSVRRNYHALAADWLIAHSGERQAEFLGLIAGHLEEAGDEERALAYLQNAIQQASGQYANAEAIDYLSRALNLTPVDEGVARYELLLQREQLHNRVGERERQIEDLDVLEALAESLDANKPGAENRRAEVALRRSRYARSTGDLPEAIRLAQAAIDLAKSDDQAVYQARGYLAKGVPLHRQGNEAEAGGLFERALRLAQQAGEQALEIDSLNFLARFAWYRGDLDTVRIFYERALEISRQIGDKKRECDALSYAAIYFYETGDHAKSRTVNELNLRISRQIGDRQGQSRACCDLGETARQVGEYDKARQYYIQSLNIARQIGDQSMEAIVSNNLGMVLYREGDHQSAREHAEFALSLNHSIGQRIKEGYAQVLLGRAYSGLGDWETALGAYREAVIIFKRVDHNDNLMESYAGMADVLLSLGKIDEALAQVEEILILNENNSVDGAEEPLWIYLVCYRVLNAAADSRSLEVLTKAYEMLEEQAALIADKHTRRIFLEQVPYHADIVQAYRQNQPSRVKLEQPADHGS
jgi:class 3 adenylate cyclase/predicted ATPase